MLEKIKCILNNYKHTIYIAPHNLLKPYIAHYTISILSENTKNNTLTLIPDASGCIISEFSDKGLVNKFWGATTKTTIVQNDIENIPFRVFIEFLPCGAYQLTGLPQMESADLRIQLEDFNRTLNSDINLIFEKIDSLKELIYQLDNLFLTYLFKSNTKDITTSILLNLRKQDSIISVKDISQISCYSERHLNRVFNNSLGVSVKTYLRLLRINIALQKINTGKVSLTELAQNIGYYDQPHFIHDFKSICGVTPTAYIKNLSDFYNENYKF